MKIGDLFRALFRRQEKPQPVFESLTPIWPKQNKTVAMNELAKFRVIPVRKRTSFIVWIRSVNTSSAWKGTPR